MTRLEWNENGTSIYEYGVDRGVFYPRVGDGVPWNGLVSVEDGSAGGEHTPYYFNGIKYCDFMAAEDYQATVEAFATPPEFAACDGAKQLSPGLYATQQRRERFGFSYRTLIGNEHVEQLAYRLHIVYNATAAPSSRLYSTVGQIATAPTRSWTFHTVPPGSTTYKPTAHFVIDSREVDPAKLTSLENRLYGSPTWEPHIPTQAAVINLLD